MRQEGLHPRFALRKRHLILVATGHGEQIADRHGLEVFGRLCWRILREKFQDRVVEVQLSFLDGQPHGGRSETFAQGVHHMEFVRRLGFPPAFRDHVTVTHEHETVHGADLPVGRFDIGANPRRRHPLGFRRAPGQGGCDRRLCRIFFRRGFIVGLNIQSGSKERKYQKKEGETKRHA